MSALSLLLTLFPYTTLFRSRGRRRSLCPGAAGCQNGGMALAEKLETLPVRPGVYLFKDAEGHVLYVGKARVLRDRVRSYFQAARPLDPQRGDMVAQIADLDLVLTDTEIEALALENQIKRCLAPCVAEICSIERYQKAAQDARLFLEGRTDEVVKSLRAQMEEAAEESRFEEAATLRDHIRALDRLDAPQKITTTD